MFPFAHISLSYGRFPPSNSTSMSQIAANRLLLCCKWTLSLGIVVLLVLFRLLHFLYSKLATYRQSCYLKHLKFLIINGQQQQQHTRCNLISGVGGGRVYVDLTPTLGGNCYRWTYSLFFP